MGLTQRDLDVIAFVDQLKVASTSIIHQVFFPTSHLRYVQKRLTMLTEEYHELQRERDGIHGEYIYWTKRKPKQLAHALLLSETYKHIHKHFNVIAFDTEVKMDNVRADGFVAYEDKKTKKKRISFIEVEISQNSLRDKIEKYEVLELTKKYKQYKDFPKMPSIIVVTDKKMPDTRLQIYKIDTSFLNFKEALMQD